MNRSTPPTEFDHPKISDVQFEYDEAYLDSISQAGWSILEDIERYNENPRTMTARWQYTVDVNGTVIDEFIEKEILP